MMNKLKECCTSSPFCEDDDDGDNDDDDEHAQGRCMRMICTLSSVTPAECEELPTEGKGKLRQSV